MCNGWSWIGWGILLGLMSLPVWSAEPDPEAVRRLMEQYEREAAPPKPAPAPKPAPKPAAKPRPLVDHDREAWEAAEKCGTVACFRAYLKKYPQGEYAEMARARLKSEAAVPAPAAPPAPSARQAFEPDLMAIDGGCFQMGSPESEVERQPREPNERQHGVCVKNFAMGRYEVTVGEFRRFVAVTDYRTDAEKNAGGKEGCYIAYQEGNEWKYGYRAGYSWKNPNFQQGDNHPVVCVSWNDALAYTEWLSRETGQRYRLPTEAEWEYAARAGTASARYWGDDSNQACQYANVADWTARKQTFPGLRIHSCPDGTVYTAPVGSFQANAWGLKDMLGNVWEWTCSLYNKDYDGAEVTCTNKNTTSPLAIRGGSWYNFPAWVRSANRIRYVPTARGSTTGFRLARSP